MTGGAQNDRRDARSWPGMTEVSRRMTGTRGVLQRVGGEAEHKKSAASTMQRLWYWVGESNSYCEIENLEY